MLRILVVLLVITLVTGAENCTPGTSVPAGDGCNTCVCMANGTLASCTHNVCAAVLQGINKRVLPEKKCTPGKSVPTRDGCNSCNCLDNGTIGNCTKKVCHPRHLLSAKYQTGGKYKRLCTPGKPFIPDGNCNYCTCSEDGSTALACSAMTCFTARSVKDEPCRSKGQFMSKDGCNKCRCNRQKIAMCGTKKCGK